jgi:type I restriction enzyme, S subunit
VATRIKAESKGSFSAKLFSADVAPRLMSWWGNSFGKDYFSSEGKQTTNLASINITKLSAFPVPPAVEQLRIVEEVERHFSLIEGIEIQTESALKRAERLRSAVLADAFTGAF